VGFKNGTDGGAKVAADALLAARAEHAFMGMTKMGQAAIFETRGNDDGHVILRGASSPTTAPPMWMRPAHCSRRPACASR